MASNSSIDSNIGTLSKLPAEIRLLTWEKLFHVGLLERQEPTLGILGTCKTIYEEASECLYSKKVMCFSIQPQWAEDKLWVEDADARYDYGEGIFEVHKLSDTRGLAWEKFPYERLKGIRVMIAAPSATDSSELS